MHAIKTLPQGHVRARTRVQMQAVLEVSGHKQLLEHNPTLRKLVGMRTPYIDPINILQVCRQRVLGRKMSDHALCKTQVKKGFAFFPVQVILWQQEG